MPSSPPVLPSHRTIDTTESSPQVQAERRILQSLHQAGGIGQIPIAKEAETTEQKRLKANNAELAQALIEMEKELNAARQATRDLAAWTLNERTRLMTEALHQRLLREDYEAILCQRDEQVVHLLALYQEAKLDHARTLVREGEVMGRPVSMEVLAHINEMRARVGLPPIDETGAVITVPGATTQHSAAYGLQAEPSSSRDDVHQGQFDATGDEAQWSHDIVMALESTGQVLGLHGATSDESGTQASEEGEVMEDEEGAYSPPDSMDPSSIVDQVDALIAEEKGRLAGWQKNDGVHY